MHYGSPQGVHLQAFGRRRCGIHIRVESANITVERCKTPCPDVLELSSGRRTRTMSSKDMYSRSAVCTLEPGTSCVVPIFTICGTPCELLAGGALDNPTRAAHPMDVAELRRRILPPTQHSNVVRSRTGHAREYADHQVTSTLPTATHAARQSIPRSNVNSPGVASEDVSVKSG